MISDCNVEFVHYSVEIILAGMSCIASMKTSKPTPHILELQNRVDTLETTVIEKLNQLLSFHPTIVGSTKKLPTDSQSSLMSLDPSETSEHASSPNQSSLSLERMGRKLQGMQETKPRLRESEDTYLREIEEAGSTIAGWMTENRDRNGSSNMGSKSKEESLVRPKLDDCHEHKKEKDSAPEPSTPSVEPTKYISILFHLRKNNKLFALGSWKLVRLNLDKPGMWKKLPQNVTIVCIRGCKLIIIAICTYIYFNMHRQV